MPSKIDGDSIERTIRAEKDIERIIEEEADHDERLRILEEWKQSIDIATEAKRLMSIRCSLVWGSTLAFFATIGGVITEHYEIAKEAAKAALKVILEKI